MQRYIILASISGLVSIGLSGCAVNDKEFQKSEVEGVYYSKFDPRRKKPAGEALLSLRDDGSATLSVYCLSRQTTTSFEGKWKLKVGRQVVLDNIPNVELDAAKICNRDYSEFRGGIASLGIARFANGRLGLLLNIDEDTYLRRLDGGKE